MGRDAASKGSLTWLERGLQSLGASFRHVSMIVVTHSHSNHVGGLARLAEATSAKVAVHQEEKDFLDGSKPYPDPFSNPILARVTQPILPSLYPPPVKVDLAFEDGQLLPMLGEYSRD